MTVNTPERAWTDERLDDLSEKIDDGFAAADKKMEVGFAAADKKMDEGFARVDADIRELRGDIKSLRKELLAAAVIILAGVLGLIPGT
jgi:hypothetical protein